MYTCYVYWHCSDEATEKRVSVAVNINWLSWQQMPGATFFKKKKLL